MRTKMSLNGFKAAVAKRKQERAGRWPEDYDSWSDTVANRVEGSHERLYGIELEVHSLTGDDAGSSSVVEAAKNFGALAKGDGSLMCDDIEFNFPPLTVGQIKRARIVSGICKSLGDSIEARAIQTRLVDTYDCDCEDEDCGTRNGEEEETYFYGIHIHSNRGWMTDDGSARVVRTVNNNPTFFKWVACRADYNSYSMNDSLRSHAIVCLLTGRGTVEYRLFKSTDNQALVNLWLDLIVALEDWAHCPTISAARLNGTQRVEVSFFKWVEERSSAYRSAMKIIQAYHQHYSTLDASQRTRGLLNEVYRLNNMENDMLIKPNAIKQERARLRTEAKLKAAAANIRECHAEAA